MARPNSARSWAILCCKWRPTQNSGQQIAPLNSNRSIGEEALMTTGMLAFWLVLLIAFAVIEPRRAARLSLALQNIKKRREKGESSVNEALQSFVGRECIIKTLNYSNSTVIGIVTAVDGCWMTVKTGKAGEENINMINAEHITRIREYPRDKQGRKKSFFID
jgi:hypothetical protein